MVLTGQFYADITLMKNISLTCSNTSTIKNVCSVVSLYENRLDSTLKPPNENGSLQLSTHVC